jgi:hypothetical protein
VCVCVCVCVTGFENALFSIDPSDPTWRTLDPGSSDPFTIFFDTEDDIGGGGAADDEGVVWRPRARARLGMVGAPGGLYVFGGRGKSLAGDDYNPVGPRDNGPAKYGAWEGSHTLQTRTAQTHNHFSQEQVTVHGPAETVKEDPEAASE